MIEPCLREVDLPYLGAAEDRMASVNEKRIWCAACSSNALSTPRDSGLCFQLPSARMPSSFLRNEVGRPIVL